MSQRVYLFHGFNVKDRGRTTIGRLALPLKEAGYDPKVVSNAFFHLLRVRLCNKGLASAIAAMARPGSVAIAHSNAATIMWQACNYGAQFDKIILVNPALDRSKVVAPQVNKVQVWHSRKDIWTGIAKYLPASPWGSMGNKGPSFKDPRYQVIDQGEYFNTEVHHSDVFNEPLFTPFMGEVLNFLDED